MIGTVHVQGLSVEQATAAVRDRYKSISSTLRCAINVTRSLRPSQVSVFGSVTTPEILQVRGRKTLIEVLASAGGIKDDAGPIIKV